jgi:hypothetical protein
VSIYALRKIGAPPGRRRSGFSSGISEPRTIGCRLINLTHVIEEVAANAASLLRNTVRHGVRAAQNGNDPRHNGM